MPEWWPRCQGCGAPVKTGRAECEYCGGIIPWSVIAAKLPYNVPVLFAEDIVLDIGVPDSGG